MSEGDGGVARTFKFLRNGETKPVDMDWNKGIEPARQTISEAMNAKNVAFLLGAGCSSLMKDGKEVGIPTMAPLAKEFCGETLAAVAAGFNAARSASANSPAALAVKEHFIATCIIECFPRDPSIRRFFRLQDVKEARPATDVDARAWHQQTGHRRRRRFQPSRSTCRLSWRRRRARQEPGRSPGSGDERGPGPLENLRPDRLGTIFRSAFAKRGPRPRCREHRAH